MSEFDPWAELRAGRFDEAINNMRRAYVKKPHASHIMSLGVAYLWAEQYSEAPEHFLEAIRTYPRTLSAFHGMAGAASWCRGGIDHAVRLWRDGLGVDYADAAGGISIPLLLFFASTVKPRSVARHEAVDLLMERTNDPRAANWPGPLAQHIVGQMDRAAMRAACLAERETRTTLRQWLADFYVGVAELDRGNAGGFAAAMHATVNGAVTSRSERLFLNHLWHEEFFLARYESTR